MQSLSRWVKDCVAAPSFFQHSLRLLPNSTQSWRYRAIVFICRPGHAQTVFVSREDVQGSRLLVCSFQYIYSSIQFQFPFVSDWVTEFILHGRISIQQILVLFFTSFATVIHITFDLLSIFKSSNNIFSLNLDKKKKNSI